jgi:hypothetical protein
VPGRTEADADLADLAVDAIFGENLRLVDQQNRVVIDVDFSLRQSNNQISGRRPAAFHSWRLARLVFLA